jgi:hypothetical protein
MSLISFEYQQKEFCDKYKIDFFPILPNQKIGISLNVKEKILPINGLRLHPENGTSGWFIWGGLEFEKRDDFFEPLHFNHIQLWCPEIIKYLGLPPSYRFLVDFKGYEDVWQDKTLLNF